MFVVMRTGATEAEVIGVKALILDEGLTPFENAGTDRSVIAVVGEMVALAKPVAQLAAQHIETARQASRDVTALGLLEPVSLERSIATAGKELGRADEDVRLLENDVDHASANARQSAGIASDITDNTRRRMAEQGRAQVPRQASPPVASPAR